jgi:uncharacterized protein YjgD (DUF1641 family)
MANPLHFKPLPVDPRHELQRRLAAAPVEHGEALLVLWDLLQTAHDQGILDLLNGAVGAKDTIAATVAKYSATPEGIASIRNLLAAAKLLGQLDPEILDHLTATLGPTLAEATAQHRQERTPPSLWQLFRRSTSTDSRRGLSFLTLLLSSLGRSLK